MSSNLQTAVAEIQFCNYMSIVLATAVTCDYIVTLPKEINYIWIRPWTFVSFMFVIVRYLGLTLAMIDAFFGSPFIPGPVLVSTVLLLLRVWGFILFLAATEIVMILRIHAIYNRSKTILGILLSLYMATLVLYAVSGGYYNNPNTYLTMTIGQVLDMSFCNPTYDVTSEQLGEYKLIPRLILAGLMFILAIARICTECYQTYKATKQWKSNQYLQLLTKQGVIYFVGHLLYIINFGQTVPGQIISVFGGVAMYILAPRFIISVRKLYLRDLDKWDHGIDSGFSLWKSGFSVAPPPLSVPSPSATDLEILGPEATSLARDVNSLGDT